MADQPFDLFYLPFRPALDANGIVVPGASLTFYTTGTSILQTIYADAALTVPLDNPVTANSAGVWPSIYIDNTLVYRVVLRNDLGTVLNEVDPYVPGAIGGPAGATGPADNTYTSYAAMQASDPSRKSARLVGDTDAPPHPDGPYNNPTQTIGGWVPQTADGVVFKQPGFTRTMQAKAADVVGAMDLGAKGDFVQDDTTKLSGVINNLGLLGGEVEFNAGSRFLISKGAGNYCLRYTTPVSLVGKGGLFTALTPSATTANNVTTVMFEPSDVPGDFTRFENITLSNPFNGSRSGGIGILIATVHAGITAGRVLIDGVAIGPGSDAAFVHQNDNSTNLTGGLFCSEIRRSLFHRGARFDNSGDSILLTTVTSTGLGVGFEFTGTIDGAGNTPSQFVTINCNSTSQGGAFLFHRANFPTIQNANMEQTVSNPGGTLVNFLGDAKPNNSTGVRAPSLTNSLVSAFGGVNLDALVRFGSTSGGVCFNNWFLDGGGGATYDIVVTSGARDVWIGPNLSVIDDLRILDNGVGTRGGNNKALMLESGWLAPGNGEASAYTYKTIDGEITVSGGAKNGSTSPGAPIMIMPEGFRPLAIELKQCLCLDNGSWATPAVVSFNPNGEVKIVYCPNAAGSTQKLYFNATFRAAHPCTVKVQTPFVV